VFRPRRHQPKNDFIGSEQCGLCHTALYKDFYKNPHYKSIASGKESPDKTGCEGCHGAGGNHMAAGGGKDSIRAFSQMTPTQVIDTCLSCHAKDMSRANIRRSAIPRPMWSARTAIPSITPGRLSFCWREAVRALLYLPCHRSRPVQHAGETPCQRRRSSMYRLP